ncbi:integrase [Streptosporangium jomthongense]|uniref:Integrase n=1 Tax=Streptosporangium jomthongense TaxID=1193683 RepID=A0ABV8F142_9ACTN
MRITFATAPGTESRPNEDFVLATTQAALVLDGAGGPPELGSGCIHGTPWYVETLGVRVMDLLITRRGIPLTDALAEGVSQVAALHVDTCDLLNPGTPSATAVLIREHEQRLDYLVLSDAVLVLDGPDGIRHLADRRIDEIGPEIRERMNKFRPGTPEHQAERLQLVAEQHRPRNRPGGHWVAATMPEAAYQALAASLPLRDLGRMALLSDGAARYVDFALGGWVDLMAVLTKQGPEGLIAQVRQAEDGDADGVRFPVQSVTTTLPPCWQRSEISRLVRHARRGFSRLSEVRIFCKYIYLLVQESDHQFVNFFRIRPLR